MEWKKILCGLLSLIWIPIGIHAQIQSGKVTYRIQMDESLMDSIITQNEDNQALRNGIQNLFDKQKKTAPFITYQLLFNSEISHFFTPPIMNNDNGIDIESAMKNIGVYGEYFTFLKENESHHDLTYIGQDLTVLLSLDELDWKITEESKTIGGYKCYKAITHFQPDLGLGGRITAWFAPEIPFQFGPAVYAKLPGLILELQQGYYIFKADEIKLSKRKKEIKRKPKKSKIIDKQDFNTEKKRIQSNYAGGRSY